MSPTAANCGADQAALLLGDLDRDEAAVAAPERVAAELAQGMANVGKQVGVLLDEELHPGTTARLFVARQHQHEIARWRRLGRRDSHDRRHEHRHPALHVERASAPYFAVDQLAPERWV